MADVKSIMQQFFDELKKDVANNIDAKGLTASGATKASLRVEVGNNFGVLFGASHIEALEIGRGKTKSSGGGTGKSLREQIYEWLAFKKYGLNWKDEKERKSLSFAISTNIHKKGTLIHRSGKYTGVLSEIIMKERINSLHSKISEFYMFNISTQLKDALHDSFAK